MLITGAQLRAARAMAGIEQAKLAELSGISANTIVRMERQNGPLGGRAATLRALQAALEAAGVVFTNHNEPGVKQRAAA